MEDFKNSAIWKELCSIVPERNIAKLENLARERNEVLDQKFLRTILVNLFKIIPNSAQARHIVPQDVQESIRSIYNENAYVYLELKCGLKLKTFSSRQQYRNYYYCFRDKMMDFITPESYQACHDVTFRYKNGSRRIETLKKFGLYEQNEKSTIIECGAYNGWKALGFANHIGKKGKIIGIEIDEDQYNLMQENLSANLPQENFVALHTGVWNDVEERMYSFEHFASHTLKTPDKHQHHQTEKKIRTDTLDNIIEKLDVDIIDFINIQTGGSELESLQGLVRNLHKVKVLRLGTPYTYDGISIRYKSIEYALEMGFGVYDFDVAKGVAVETKSIDDVSPDDRGGFWIVSPHFKDRLVPQSA